MKKGLSLVMAALLLTKVAAMAEEESDLPTARYVSVLGGNGEVSELPVDPVRTASTESGIEATAKVETAER